MCFLLFFLLVRGAPSLCLLCILPNDMAAFFLSTFGDVRGWRRLIREGMGWDSIDWSGTEEWNERCCRYTFACVPWFAPLCYVMSLV